MAGPDHTEWQGRLELELDNVRAALAWFEGEGEAEQGLRLASAPLRFWWFGGHLAEARVRLEALLQVSGAPVSDAVRAKSLQALGVLVYRHADEVAGDLEVARSRLEESLKIYRRLGDEASMPAVLQNLARVHNELGERVTAHSLLEESLEIARRSRAERAIAFSIYHTGMMHLRGGEHSLGRVHLEESMEIFRKLEDRHWIVTCLVFLGFIDCEEGDYAAARSRLVETNELLPMAQFPWSTAVMLEGFARVATGEGRATRALRLAGATDTLRRTYGVSIGPIGDADYVRSLEPAWQALGEEEGKAAWEEGRAMTLEEALAFALEEQETKPNRPSESVLSVRELEVLSFVAEGLSDVQIAERLHLSPRTVGQHLGSVYRKLGVRGSTTAAVHKAGEMDLI